MTSQKAIWSDSRGACMANEEENLLGTPARGKKKKEVWARRKTNMQGTFYASLSR